VLERRGSELWASASGEQGSNVLLSLVRADGLAFVPAETTRVAHGEIVPVQLLHSAELRDEPGI